MRCSENLMTEDFDLPEENDQRKRTLKATEISAKAVSLEECKATYMECLKMIPMLGSQKYIGGGSERNHINCYIHQHWKYQLKIFLLINAVISFPRSGPRDPTPQACVLRQSDTRSRGSPGLFSEPRRSRP